MQHKRRIIGVFDSGVGGKSVALALERALPDSLVAYVNDVEHVPYGSKTPDEILGYVLPKLEYLVEQGSEVIVIACNTVTTTLIDVLRQRLPVTLVGIEPMVKPATQLTTAKVIAVCATPTTLSSRRYAQLKHEYADTTGTMVLEPDCSRWSSMIEQDNVDRQHIHDTVESVCAQGADVIVLGCTHYHWIEDMIIADAAGRARVLQPESAVVAEVKRVLAQLP